jgi:hypothetical protein
MPGIKSRRENSVCHGPEGTVLRLSLKRGACISPVIRLLTGNPGKPRDLQFAHRLTNTEVTIIRSGCESRGLTVENAVMFSHTHLAATTAAECGSTSACVSLSSGSGWTEGREMPAEVQLRNRCEHRTRYHRRMQVNTRFIRFNRPLLLTIAFLSVTGVCHCAEPDAVFKQIDTGAPITRPVPPSPATPPSVLSP